jgi:hypothetical protein
VRVELALSPEYSNVLATAHVEVVRTISDVQRSLPEDVLTSSTTSFPNAAFESVSGAPPGFSWVPFDLPSIDVAIGDELAIVVSSGVPHGHQWVPAFPGSYSPGEGFWGPPSNMSHTLNFDIRVYLFRTYVVPIPNPRPSLLRSLAHSLRRSFAARESGGNRAPPRCREARIVHSAAKSYAPHPLCDFHRPKIAVRAVRSSGFTRW